MYPTSHCDKHCLNMKISLIIVIEMLHYIVIYSMLHCYIMKFWFNTKFIILGSFNIQFIILNLILDSYKSSISVYNINPLGLLIPWTYTINIFGL